MTAPTGRLRRIGPDRWSIELAGPGAPKIGEVVLLPDGFRILFMDDTTGTCPLSRVCPGPHRDMAAVTSEIQDGLRWSSKLARR